MSDDTYKTITKTSEGIYKDRGSKFFGFAIPVTNEEQAKAELDQLKKQYHDARHHCFAYRLGWDYAIYRINDDGEPSGTAGKPVFGQIRSFGLTNVLIVVIRYFGGVKLGVRGLIDAYKGAAQSALENNTIQTMTVKERLHLHFGYAQMGRVMHVIKERKITQLKTDLQLECDIEIAVRRSKSQEIQNIFQTIEHVNISSKGFI